MAEEVVTFDEILSDPIYKAEFDKRVAKALETVQTKLDATTDQLKTAQDGLKAFDGVDVGSLKEQVSKLQGDIAAKDTEYQQKIAEMEFGSLLDGAIAAAKGKNAKAVRGLLDLDALKSSKNQSEDIKAALAALKESDGYLFDDAPTPPPYATGTGSAKIENITKEQFAKMGYRELLELKKSNPEQYDALKE